MFIDLWKLKVFNLSCDIVNNRINFSITADKIGDGSHHHLIL